MKSKNQLKPKRKSLEKGRSDWKIPITVMLNLNEIDIIDEERDGTPRSVYLRGIIIKAIHKK